MTKQEIIEIIKSKCIPIYDDVVGYDFDWISDTLLAKIEQEKKDTLKEFVEFVEDMLTIWIKDENCQANIAEAENDHLRKNISLLIAETIEAIKNSMKPALEKFLEERK